MTKRLVVILAVLTLVMALPAMAKSDGAALYKASCATCHGANGAGDTAVGKSMKVRDLRSAEVQKQTDIELTKIISGGKGKMPAYGKKMSEADVAALIATIRSLK
ncbi:MAG TPA: cytochrome c [Thermoanaerobaculia bacterium]|nr:cytochrome c [Thermoanaerobaculia bacterium]